MMGPGVVKHWGIWPVTWKRYLFGLGIQISVLAGLFAIWRLLPRPLPSLTPGEDWVTVLLVSGVVANTGWILLAFALFTVIDAAVMLHRFANKRPGRPEPGAI